MGISHEIVEVLLVFIENIQTKTTNAPLQDKDQDLSVKKRRKEDTVVTTAAVVVRAKGKNVRDN